jgi:chromate transporter
VEPDVQTQTLSELTRQFARIGCLGFGGPAAQIAMMHSELVVQLKWVRDDEFLHALNFCHLLPGPEAQQLATWIGWRLHGQAGGLLAGLLFIGPGALVVLLLSILYAFAAELDWFAALFLGIKAVVLAIVVQALIRIARRALDTRFKQLVAFAAFCALFFLSLPFVGVVLGAGALGLVVAALRPDWLGMHQAARPRGAPTKAWGQSLRAIAIYGSVWMAPMLAVWLLLGPDHILWSIGKFFAQLATVSFGGAYAVLAFMAQDAVHAQGWLSAGEMADGLGLAETTPGPLILVTQFVGFLAAFRFPDPFSPVVAGVIGAALTSWVVFAPSFLWIFAFAPWLDQLASNARLRGALATLSATIVGVIANLALWFFLHVLFARVARQALGPLTLHVPELASLDWRVCGLALAAMILILRFNWNIMGVLALGALGGLAMGAV